MESFKLRLGIVLFVAFLMSGYYSFQEMRYLISGRAVEATVDSVEIRTERVYRRRMGSTTREYQQVMLHFPNQANSPESRSLRLSASQPIRAQQSLAIQYLPGQTDMIRLQGSANWFSVLFFLGSLIAGAGMLVWVGMEANRPYATSRHVDSDRPVRAIEPKKKKRVLKPLKPLDE